MLRRNCDGINLPQTCRHTRRRPRFRRIAKTMVVGTDQILALYPKFSTYQLRYVREARDVFSFRAPNKTGKGARGFPGARSVAHLATKAAVWRGIQGMRPAIRPLTQANLEDK